MDNHKKSRSRFKSYNKKKLSFLSLKSFKPSIITGAADNDPSAIANYSQAGARFGFDLLWLVIFLYPFITVIVGICAKIGSITGSGLTSTMCKKYSKKIVFPIVVLLIIGNIINISADIGVMAVSINLIIPLSSLSIDFFISL